MSNEEDFVDAEVLHVDLKKDILSDILWRTKDGRQVRVGDMNDKHIRNCALFLMDFGFQICIASQPVRLKWLYIFSIEWKRRLAARQNGIKVRVKTDPFEEDNREYLDYHMELLNEN